MRIHAVLAALPAVLLASLPAAAQDELRTHRQSLEGESSRYWTDTTIPVCFRIIGSQPRDKVQRLIARTRDLTQRTWDAVSGIEFTGFGTCQGTSAKGIQVQLRVMADGRSRADQGPGGDGIAIINLHIDARDYSIVHEFGHALGFGHSQAREDTPGYCLDELGGSGRGNVSDELTPFDDASIMNYCRRGEGGAAELSALDVVGVIEVYGHDRSGRLGMNEDGDMFGTSLAVGDVNADGHPDVLIGAPGEAIGDKRRAGAAFLLSGNGHGALRPVSGVQQTGLGDDEAGDAFGYRVLMADLDGEGGDELVVFAPHEVIGDIRTGYRPGAIFAYSVTSTTPAGYDPVAGDLTVEPLASYHLPRTSSGLGYAGVGGVAAGDLDGDGRDEIWFTALSGTEDGLYGIELKPGTTARGPSAWEVVASRLTPRNGDGENGPALALLVADVLGGGGDELVAGYPSGVVTGNSVGFVRVLGLSNGELTTLSTLVQGSIGDGPEPLDAFGSALAAGDFDGDGDLDLAVGARGEDHDASGPRAGAVTVFRNQWTLREWEYLTQEGTDAGNSEADDLFGERLAAGDFDGDGIDDLALSTDEQVPHRTERPGYAYVLYGSPSGMGRGHYVSQHPLGANEDGDRFGSAMAMANLDGGKAEELIIGVPGEAPGPEPKAGFVFVYRTPYRPLEAWYAFGQQF